MKKWIIILAGLIIAQDASALMTEFGVQYWRKKTSFDADNYLDSESLTGSISFYFMERLALELSYTDATAVREEKIYSGSTVIQQQTVVQVTNVIGADLIFVLSDRKAFLQPYIKGGAAQITRKQEVKVNNLNTYELDPEKAIVPSYGAGLKIAVTDTFGIKLSYDAWQTPIGGGTVTNDSQIRAGVSWLL
jgi:hypothetical protein